jgi:hypothetical protein
VKITPTPARALRPGQWIAVNYSSADRETWVRCEEVRCEVVRHRDNRTATIHTDYSLHQYVPGDVRVTDEQFDPMPLATFLRETAS